ncbi:MAG: hypothetical protein AAGA18_15535 [Verrucomicrobiota bacterium]
MKGSRKIGKKGPISLKEPSNQGFKPTKEAKNALFRVEENSSRREIFPAKQLFIAAGCGFQPAGSSSPLHEATLKNKGVLWQQ